MAAKVISRPAKQSEITTRCRIGLARKRVEEGMLYFGTRTDRFYWSRRRKVLGRFRQELRHARTDHIDFDFRRGGAAAKHVRRSSFREWRLWIGRRTYIGFLARSADLTATDLFACKDEPCARKQGTVEEHTWPANRFPKIMTVLRPPKSSAFSRET